ncbi:hypothetical protein [Paraburkholderia kururiensis]|uniref:hypothetical protein n=1 Tax=Paraburkholderia kururiensis TaxID=984307 RepID=UPI001267F537|nr:hypothetical protein [Paraburkholderia kururiensis]
MRKKLRVALIGIIFVIAPFTSYATDNTLSTSDPLRLVADMGQKCIISVKDYFKGHLASGMPLNASYWTEEPPVKTLMPKFSVNFVCSSLMDQSKNEIARRHGATYDRNKKKWTPYFDSERDAKILGKFTTLHSLNTTNGSGFYVIQDDRDGDPAQRERYLSFCIFHETIALCGSEPVMYISDPKGNLLPYALDIIRSVEFIDDSGRKSAPASAAVIQ